MAQAPRRGIKSSLKVAFGDEGLTLFPEIKAIHDHRVLEEVLYSLEIASTLDEVCQVWRQKHRKNQ